MDIYCAGCKIHLARIMPKSKIKLGAVMLCDNCNTKRIASDMARPEKPWKHGKQDCSFFDEIFGRN